VNTEETNQLSPRFDERGLIAAIAQDAGTGEVLMLAWMNEQALALTIETGIAHYWSRSRNSLWKKGETSGELQQVVEMRMDCDQDAVLMRVVVQGHGTACHTGRTSCFYRSLERQEDGSVKLVFTGSPRVDPAELYRNK
jgi:phosphoribosyl-AMP cyclohydrolase